MRLRKYLLARRSVNGCRLFPNRALFADAGCRNGDFTHYPRTEVAPYASEPEQAFHTTTIAAYPQKRACSTEPDLR